MLYDNPSHSSQCRPSVNTYFLAMIGLIPFSGNSLVLITITRFMDKTNVTNIFVANLSISDILVLLFCLPFRVNITNDIFRSNIKVML